MAARTAAAPPSALDRLSTTGRVALGAVFVVLLAAVYYIGFYGDVSTDIANAKSKNAALTNELAAAKVSEQAYLKDLDEKTQHEKNVRELKKALPDDAEVPTFLAQLQNYASIAGISLTEWKPQQEVVGEYYVRVPMSLKLSGRFHQILKFINDTSKSDRITNIEDIKLKSPKLVGDDMVVEAECTAIAFRGVKPGETPTKRGPR